MVSQQPGSQDFATLGAEQGGGWGFSPAVLGTAALGGAVAYPWMRRQAGNIPGAAAGVRQGASGIAQQIRYPGAPTVRSSMPAWQQTARRAARPAVPGFGAWAQGAAGTAGSSLRRGAGAIASGNVPKRAALGLGGAGFLVNVATDPYGEGGKVETAGDYLSAALYGAGAGMVFGPAGAAIGAAGAVTVKGLMDFFGGKKDSKTGEILSLTMTLIQ